ncbi:MAG TPA: hypothetical protein PKD64_11865 [Pirellulaceae bacterium]|nr:hypothetical protein [Pirellulaceae bacterium]HMO92881.1 hypothetical protein [Pirellulaceae bacterium]HMP69160.1 hypothetical protein [Pirellulaceae bacterium]
MFEFPPGRDPNSNHDFGKYRLKSSAGHGEWEFTIEYKSQAAPVATVQTGSATGSEVSKSEIEYYDDGSWGTLTALHYHVLDGNEATYTFEHYVVKVIRVY